jgi:tripartite ATP-independent transporter DctM subunit
MMSEIVGVIGLAGLLICLSTGMPIGLSAAFIGFLGIWHLSGLVPALGLIGLVPYSKAATYAFTVLPLFVVTGYFALNAGIAAKTFETGKRWMGHLPGGLAMATIASCAAFGACCGMSVATTAIMGRLVIPEMEKLNYKHQLAAGVVAASGTFAAMIPPSGIMVIYAIMAEVSVGKMLMAGLFPGLLTALAYGGMLYVRVKRNPSLTGELIPPFTWKERFRSLPQLWSVFIIAFVIIGGIYTGIFTPTEAAAIGALVSLILLLITKAVNRRDAFAKSIHETAKTTAMIFLIIIGIVIFAKFLAISRLPYTLVEWIAGLDINRYGILACILFFYIILGMFMESIGMLLLSIPVALPIIESLHFDPIWFGVIVIKTIEIALVTPPVGLNVYVLKGIAPQIAITDIFKGSLPFIIMDILVLILMILFPQIVLFLPAQMGN